VTRAAARPAPRRLDVLRAPVIGAFLRWRYARFVLQVPLLALALLGVYDGLTGRQIAPANTATVAVWVHYRGLVALAIAAAGNLFCAACPLMLTRGPSRALSRLLPTLAWPRALRNKYTVVALTVAFLFCYEHFDLWASPWLTAWLVIGYFAAALLVDSLFPAGTFCKYVCPLGNFNFALAGASPLRIAARDADVCASCEGKYCVNGREEAPGSRRALEGPRALLSLEPLPAAAAAPGRFPGCETDLFVPAIRSSQDCTLCLNCLRACPYDNVALEVRSPAAEAAGVVPRADWGLFVTVLAWAGLVNAFAMVPTFHALAAWLSGALGTRDEALLLAVIQGGGLGLGVALSTLAARLSGPLRPRTAGPGRLREWAPVTVPLALAVWGGHYLYHFVTGASTLLPNAARALVRLGVPVAVPAVSVPAVDSAFLWQVLIVYAGLMLSGLGAFNRATRLGRGPRAAAAQLALALVLAALALLVFAQPMEARGSLLGL
jgi:polyferredoxin